MKNKEKNKRSKKVVKGLVGMAIYNLISPFDVVSYAAGVIVDENALAEHQAIIRKTRTNIDQIDIAKPNNNGLSHNKFLKFNVDENGMVINNSSQMTISDLAGLIYGNPNIDPGKEATVILSEVTGLTRSEIEGFIEIAGKEAEFILANPNGIYLSNGGFLNTSKVTMTTGKLLDEVNQHGGLVFKIDDGQVELASGGSINIARVDYFNIISKAAKIGGALHSGRTENRSTEEIKILTGSNTFNYETGDYTSDENATSNYEYGIDASELGAMSAGKITLIATDKGVGVNSKGNLVATLDDLTVDSKGNVLLKTAATRHGNISIKSEGDITQDGDNGLILSEKNLDISAKGNVSLQAKSGYVKGKDNVRISADEVSVSNGTTLISMDENENRDQNIEINTEKMDVYGENSVVVAGKTLEINVKSEDQNGAVNYSNQNELYNEGNIIGEQVLLRTGKIENSNNIRGRDILEINSMDVNNSGEILGVNSLNISGNRSFLNSGEISSNGDLNIESYDNLLNSGKILSNQDLSLDDINSILNDDDGVLQSGEDTSISSNTLNNKGNVYAKELGISSNGVINEGLFYAEGNVNISGKDPSNGTLINKASGRIISKTEANISSSRTLLNEGSISGEKVVVSTKDANNSGTIVAGGDSLEFNINDNLVNSGTLLSKNNIEISAENLVNRETGAFLTGKYFDEEGNLVEASEGTKDVNINVSEKTLNSGNIEAANDINIDTKDLENKEEGYLYSHNDMNLDTTNLKNEGNIVSLNEINSQSENFINESTGELNSRKNTNINSLNLNNAGNLISAENILLETTETTTNSGQILANENIEINRIKDLGDMTDREKTGTTDLSNSGTINATQDVLIAANEVRNTGKIYSGNKLELDLNSLNNDSGELVTNGELKIDMTNIDNVNHGNIIDIIGKVYGDRLISIKNFNDIINDQIDLMTNGDIVLESTNSNIVNGRKIVAGEDLTLNAINGRIINISRSGEVLLNAGESLVINAIDYVNNRNSKIIGGVGSNEINLKSEFDNIGKILATGGTTTLNIDGGNKSFTNSGQVAVGGDLEINAANILVKTDTLVYARNEMRLNAEVSDIVNQAGAEILTTIGDMTLNAKGDVKNEATATQGGRIKAGGSLIVTAINLYNEAVKYQGLDRDYLPFDLLNMSDREIWALVLTDAVNRGDIRRGTNHNVTENSNGFTMRLLGGINMESFFDHSDRGLGAFDDFIISYTMPYNFSPRGDYKFGDVEPEKTGTTRFNREMHFRTAPNTVRVKQASMESGGDMTLHLQNNIENRGIIRADRNIDINAARVHNITEEEQMRVLTDLKLHFRTVYESRHNHMYGPYDRRIEKISEMRNFVSNDRALISAGGVVSVHASTVLNTTSLNNSISDSLREHQNAPSLPEDNIDTGEEEDVTTQAPEDTSETDTQPEEPDEERIKGVDTIIDTKDAITIPTGDNGLFKRSEDVELGDVSKPLIETNLEYIDQANFYGSSYVFEKLGIDPEDQTRRLGDNYYETRLVNDMYLKATGGRRTEDGDIDEASLMKYLLDNSVLAEDELGLVVGEELTAEQMAGLDRDIVWYVKEMVDGVEVLVPKIYVTSNSIEKGTLSVDGTGTGSAIRGEYVSIDSQVFNNQGGKVRGETAVQINANDINNRVGAGSDSEISGGDINLHAVNNIDNTGGLINGSGSVVLKTDTGNIINSSTVRRERYFDGYSDKVDSVGYIGGENVLLDSGNDIDIIGGRVNASGTIGVKAQGDITVDALELHSLVERSSDTETYKRTDDVHAGSSLSAGEGITVIGQQNVDIRGSELKTTEGNIGISGDKVTITSLKDVSDSTYHRDDTTSWFDTDEETIKDYSETLASASLNAGTGSVQIVSNQDLDLTGVQIDAKGDENLLMSREGEVNVNTLELERHYSRDVTQRSFFSDSQSGISATITGARETVVGDYDDTGDDGSSNAKVRRASSPGINAGAESLHGKGYTTDTTISAYGGSGSVGVALFNQTEISETLDATMHAKSNFNVGDISMVAKGDVNLESLGLNAEDSTVKIVSQEGNVNTTYVQDVIKTTAEQDTVSVGVTMGYSSPLLDLAETVKNQVDYSNDSEFSDGSAGEVAARAAEIGGRLSKMTDGNLVSGKVELGVSVSHSEKETESRTALDSTFNAANILISAENGDVNLSGAQVTATEDLGVKALNLNVEASESSYHEEEMGYQVGVTTAATASVSAKSGADVGAEVGVSTSSVVAHVDSTTHNNAVLTGSNVNLDITNDVNLTGANIKGDNIIGNIGGDLNIKSVQDTLEQRLYSQDTNVTAGVSVDVTGKVSGNGSLGVTHGQIHEDKAWVAEQAGINGGHVSLKVGGNTDLQGGEIVSQDNQLDFETGSLTYSDIEDSHVRDGGYGGFGASFSKEGIDSVDVKGGRIEGFDRAQTVHATIGQGNVVVGGQRLEDTGASGINRDADNAIETTRDETHFKFDLDYTISPGDFRRDKSTSDSPITPRRNDSDSGIRVSRSETTRTDRETVRSPLPNGRNIPRRTNERRPEIRTDVNTNTKINTENPVVDSGRVRRVENSIPDVNSGVEKVQNIVTPSRDTGVERKVIVNKPDVDSGIERRPSIEGINKINQPPIVNKVESPTRITGDKTSPERQPVNREVSENVKLRRDNLEITSPERETKRLTSRPVQDGGEAAKIRDRAPVEENISDYTAKRGTEVSLGKEIQNAIETAQRKGEDPYVATNKLLAAQIRGQENFFRNKGYGDLIGNNYDEVQKNQLHRIVRRSGPNSMEATDKGALMKFVNDLDTYNLGLKAAKAAVDANDPRAARRILNDIRDFGNIKVDSEAFRKYTAVVNTREQQKVQRLEDSGRNKEIVPTEREIQEAKENGGSFIRRENGKLVKYDTSEIVKDTNFRDEDSGSVVNRRDFDNAEYNSQLNGRMIKISEDSDSSRVWLLPDGSDKPIIKEIPNYQYERGTERFKDPLTSRTYTKAEIEAQGRIPLNGDNSRYLRLNEDGEPVIEREVSVDIEGSEKLLDPKTGQPLIGRDGKEITVKSLEGLSSRIEDFGGRRFNGVTIELADGRRVFFKERVSKPRPNAGDIVGVGGNNYYRNSGMVNVKDSATTKENSRDSYIEKPHESFTDKYKEAAIFSEERTELVSFKDPVTGREITRDDFSNAEYNENLGGKVLSTSDPNRKLILRDDGEMESIRLPETDIVPGTERFVDPMTNREVSTSDIRNAEVNSLLGKRALEIGDGRYFTLNDDGSVGVTEITSTVDQPSRYLDPKTNQEMTERDFDSRKVHNDDLNMDVVEIGNGRYFVKDADGDIKVATLSDVQERPRTIIDSTTGERITDGDFDSRKVHNDDLGTDAVEIGNGRYFVKDTDGNIVVTEIQDVKVRDEKVIDTDTGVELTDSQFNTLKHYNDDLKADVVDLGNNRYFFRDADGDIKITEVSEVQERPRTIIDSTTGERITDSEFDSRKVHNDELNADVVEIGNGRYFVKDTDGDIKITEISEVQERPETIKDSVTGRELTNEQFDESKRYNIDLGKEAVEIGDGRYFVKDTDGQVQIVTLERTEIRTDHIIDPVTGREVTRQDIENSDIDHTLGERGVKIEDGRYFKLNDDGDIVIKEFVDEGTDVFYDKDTSEKITVDDIKNAPVNSEIGEKGIKIDDNHFYVLNDKNEVEKLEIRTVEKTDYEITGQEFNKRLTEEEYNTLSTNPELNGKVLNLGNDKFLVMKENGEGYLTNREKLENNVATETVNTLLNDGLTKNDARRLREVLAASKDNSRLSSQMKADLNALYRGSQDKNLSDKDLIQRVNNYMSERNKDNSYLNEKTGEIYNLNRDNFRKVDDSSDKETVYTIDSNRAIKVDKETGEATVQETRRTWAVWEGRKDWAIYKLGQKIFGTKNSEETQDSSNPNEGRPLPTPPSDEGTYNRLNEQTIPKSVDDTYDRIGDHSNEETQVKTLNRDDDHTMISETREEAEARQRAEARELNDGYEVPTEDLVRLRKQPRTSENEYEEVVVNNQRPLPNLPEGTVVKEREEGIYDTIKDGDDDELVMIDNPIYESSNPNPNEGRVLPKVPRERREETQLNNDEPKDGYFRLETPEETAAREKEEGIYDTIKDGDDDELVMIDNPIYESSNPNPNKGRPLPKVPRERTSIIQSIKNFFNRNNKADAFGETSQGTKTVSERNSQKIQDKINKVSSLETSNNWKRLKDATNVRYLQKVAEDPEIMKLLKDRADGADLEGGLVQVLKGMNPKEEKELIERLAIKKEEAFNEASKRIQTDNSQVKIVDRAELNKGNPEGNILGLHKRGTNEVLLSNTLPTAMKLEVLDHEIGHKYQANVYRDKDFAENAGLRQDYDAFKYDAQNGISHPEYYKESILERDTRRNEKVTRKGLDQIGEKLLDSGEKADRDNQGYVAIDSPKPLLNQKDNPFVNKDVDTNRIQNELDNLIVNKDQLINDLSSDNQNRLEKIVDTYNDFKNLNSQIGENDRRLMLDNLNRDLEKLLNDNPQLKTHLEKVIKEEDIKIDIDVEKDVNQASKRALKASETSRTREPRRFALGVKVPEKASTFEQLASKYQRVKNGVRGQEGNTYGLNSKREGRKLQEAEEKYNQARDLYSQNPTTKNEKAMRSREEKFHNLLVKNEGKMNLVLSQENLDSKDILDRRVPRNDKYQGKVMTVRKDEIGLIKPTVKLKSTPLPKEVLAADYTKGTIQGSYYQGKPGITDDRLKPENIDHVKDNTINILVHGTFSATAPDNGWTKSDGEYAKALNDQYGGESVAFRWSGKNTADSRREGGEELARIIEEYNRKGIRVNVVAHSHGGNVVNEALKRTHGQIENMVTLGTPVRKDHQVDRELIEKRTGHYLNVMSNEDSVTRKGGTDFKTNVAKYITGENKIGRAHRKDMNADKVLKIDGASHSDLHSLAVIKQLKPQSRKDSPLKPELAEGIILKEAFSSEYGRELADLSTAEKMSELKRLARKSREKELDFTEKLIVGALQESLDTSPRYRQIQDKIDSEFAKRVLRDKELAEKLALNKDVGVDGKDHGFSKDIADKIVRYRMEAFQKITGIKPSKDIKVTKLSKEERAEGFRGYFKGEDKHKTSADIKDADKIVMNRFQKMEDRANRTLQRLQILNHELTHKEQLEIIRHKEEAKRLGISEDRKLLKYSGESYDLNPVGYRNNVQEKDAFRRQGKLDQKIAKELENKGHVIKREEDISKPVLQLENTTNKDVLNSDGYIDLRKKRNEN